MNFERKVIGELLMMLLIEMSNRRKTDGCCLK